MFRFRPRSRAPRGGNRRNIDQEKIIAKTFVKFLEDGNRKEDMFVHELRQIYQGEFCASYETLGMSFSKLLNTLTYHLNLCQQLQDRIIFGGGETAALQLLTADGPEGLESSEDEDDFFSVLRPHGAFHCNVCKRSLGNAIAYNTHMAGVKHRQQRILKKIRKSLEKPELVFDKHGIKVTSNPHGDENCVVELRVESGTYGQIVLIIENTSDQTITLQHITLMWSVNFFDYSEIARIGHEGILQPETSLLERLMTSCSAYSRGIRGRYNSDLLTKLVNNYRSHRTIIEIPKQLFYDNELNECAGDFRNVMLGWEELPNKNFPIIFHPVYGKDEREGVSPSFFNVAEVETIERYLKKLLDDNVRSRGLKHLRPEMIGVISPYKRQVQKIQKMIEKRHFGPGIKVGSVEEFQGQERRVIILSTVRSTKKEFLEMDKDFHLGFLNNPKRFNVAITRAQALLILIGNPDMLCLDENWKRFLEYCDTNNACVAVERKDKVEDIADTLKRLNLSSAASSEIDEDSEISQRQLQEHPEWTRHE